MTFGVLSVMYVMILEVVLVAILVFVVGPILFVRFDYRLYLTVALALTLRSCFGAFSYSVSAVTHHKTHIISHPTSDKSHGL
jgi:hypothetical protein